ncbi:RNA polymerase sigma factor [Prosthecomicrobium pneumaticum]|uniref:RNA polymerase sigma-70 factor (ECF subfamily) n=1 Tax=Prosthecomicrobium pneumaticum TaxID=81895 RepID=A0A7W9FR07_9HYPH|nr:RNA polymerase subunit sigma-70 [Prosthecomicrobium pneumaticum]MBB5755233.1 RNA polymerase sigma-70 factor (ECF subfamily) [Prosthecomicrobium pneumaticum]
MSAVDDPTPVAPPAPGDSTPRDASAEALWRATLQGDRDAFQRLVGPYLDELFAAARRDVRYHSAVGDLREDEISPEEVVGETLLRAWRDRHRRPQGLDIRPWLLGLQFRVLTRIVRQEQVLRKLVSVSLEAPAPAEPIYDDDESFWEWYQPDEMLRWEDIVPADVTAEAAEPAVFEREVPGLSALARQVLVLRHVHRFSVGEIASVLGLSARRIAELWQDGHALLVSTKKEAI